MVTTIRLYLSVVKWQSVRWFLLGLAAGAMLGWRLLPW